jgi:thiamine biosynthesis lipoprotein
MVSDQVQPFSLKRRESHWVASFQAMSCPCEVLIRASEADESEVARAASLAFSEAARIEKKFSRYLSNNIVYAINHSEGLPIALDDETYQLLSYAGQCWELSDGLFDVTSGILRRAWKFDGQPAHPDQSLISELVKNVGWEKVELTDHSIRLRHGMEIDLGGIGKEYAADRVAQMLFESTRLPLMVNFGGDIRACAPDTERVSWDVGIEDPSQVDQPIGVIELLRGAVTSSGDSHRCCFVDGRRLGHILNPRTGWPVVDSPRSVTVLGDYCTEAGLISTLALLHGADAEEFLEAQGVTYHCIR